MAENHMTARREGKVRRITRLLLIIFYCTAGVAHLVFTDAMVRIVPPWIPQPKLVVLATGVAEIAGALGLVTVRWRHAAGWSLAAYALCVWPANVQHAIIDLGTGTGLPVAYHVPRLLLQPFIIWWALWASGAVTDRRARHP
jgi:uncharacterized membrane protein